jgi:hypothetical protein
VIRFCSVYVVCVLRYFIVCTVVLILRGRGEKEVEALRIASFGIASFGIASFEIASSEIASFSTKGSNCFLCGRLASFEYGYLKIK